MAACTPSSLTIFTRVSFFLSTLATTDTSGGPLHEEHSQVCRWWNGGRCHANDVDIHDNSDDTGKGGDSETTQRAVGGTNERSGLFGPHGQLSFRPGTVPTSTRMKGIATITDTHKTLTESNPEHTHTHIHTHTQTSHSVRACQVSENNR